MRNLYSLLPFAFTLSLCCFRDVLRDKCVIFTRHLGSSIHYVDLPCLRVSGIAALCYLVWYMLSTGKHTLLQPFHFKMLMTWVLPWQWDEWLKTWPSSTLNPWAANWTYSFIIRNRCENILILIIRTLPEWLAAYSYSGWLQQEHLNYISFRCFKVRYPWQRRDNNGQHCWSLCLGKQLIFI